MTYIFKDDKTIRVEGIVGNHHYNQHEKELVMKPEPEETTCQLDIAGKCNVETSVKVPVKGIKFKFKNK